MGLRIIHVVTEDNIEFAFQFLVLPDGIQFEFGETPWPLQPRGDDPREERPA